MARISAKEHDKLLRVLNSKELIEHERNAWLAIWLANARGDVVPQDEMGFRTATSWNPEGSCMDAVENLESLGLCTISAKGCIAVMESSFESDGEMSLDDLLATTQKGIEDLLVRGIAGLTVTRRGLPQWVVRVPRYWTGIDSVNVVVIDRRYFEPDDRFFVVSDGGQCANQVGVERAGYCAKVYGCGFDGGEIVVTVDGAHSFLPCISRVAGATALALSLVDIYP